MGDKMKIGIATDHRGFQLKQKIIEKLENRYEIKDYGTYNTESTDYPIYAFKLCEDMKNIDFGILLCGTGIGMSIAANKVKNIRCAKVSTEEEAILSREHNNANVMALSTKLDLDEIIRLIDIFVKTEFSNEERHIKRNNMVDHYAD